MAHLRSAEEEEVAGGGESSLGRAVLAVLERLEKRVGLLEERVAEVALATTAESSSGPSTSLGTMLEDVLVKLYQIEGRVDSIEKRQETAREEKEQRRSDKRRAATALLRQQGYAIPHHHQQRPNVTRAVAPLVSPRPPTKKPPSLPRSVSAVTRQELASDGDHQRHLNEQADHDVDDGCEEQDMYDESGCSGEDYYAVGDEGATTVEAERQTAPAPAADSNLFVGGGVRKPLPAFPTSAGGRRAVTAYLPLSQSSELLLQLAEMELHERQTTA